MEFENRLKAFRSQMNKLGWAGAFLAPSGDMEYLIGVRRRRPNATKGHMHGDWLYGAILTETDCVFVSPYLAHEHIVEQTQDKPWITDIVKVDDGADVSALASDLLKSFGLSGNIIGIPREAMASSVYEIQKIASDTVFLSTWDIVAPMRAIKDPDEIELMRKAATITDKIFDDVRKHLSYGMNESDIMIRVEDAMLNHGTEGSSFVTGIMIKGPGIDDAIEGISRAGTVELQPGRVLAFDFGVVLNGYVSDFGRTLYCGDPDVELRRIHDLVIQSQSDGIAAMKSGMITAQHTNEVARAVIEDAGYGKNFVHRLGHGIGIDVHEPPFLAPGDTTILQSGMCFTVEPSIWVSGKCFTRVEDVVLVTEEGGVSLNTSTRDIHVL